MRGVPKIGVGLAVVAPAQCVSEKDEEMKRKRKKEQLEEKSRDKNRINKKVDYEQGGIDTFPLQDSSKFSSSVCLNRSPKISN